MKNPFVTNGYAGEEYFCDRVQETESIIRLLTNGNNIALMSPRRIGKTDLIRHCFAQKALKEDYYLFLIDIYSTKNLQDFVNVFGKAIIDGLKNKGRSAWDKFLQMVMSVRSEISFDINGAPVWGVSLGSIHNPTVTLYEIFQYLAAADKPCIVAIDEFQQITHYPDASRVEAELRTYIQHCSNANFIFSGSHRHLMGEMFTSPSRPFYQSVTPFNLKPIPVDKYIAFATEKFAQANKNIEAKVIEELFRRFNSITSYIQKIMNYMYNVTPENGTCTLEMIDSAINYLLDISSDTYQSFIYQMPEKQRNVFIAIAREGVAKNISGGNFVKKYKLPSSSAVVSAVKGLIDKDFITQELGEYTVYDRFFQLWIEREYVNK